MPTYFLGSVLDVGTLSTASDITTASGATAIGKDTPLGTLTGYGELCPNNAPGTWPAAVSESAVAPSGKGNILPGASLNNVAIIAGTWTPTVRLSVTGTGVASITADILVRVWKWNSSTLAYTKFGVATLTGQTIASASTTFTVTGVSLQEISLATNEFLYIDVLCNVTANPNGAGIGTKIRCNFSNSSTQGNATGQVVSPATAPFRSVPAKAALLATSMRTISSNKAALGKTRTIIAKAAMARTRQLAGKAALAKTRTVPAKAALIGSTSYFLGSVLDGSLLTTASDISTASGATSVGKDTPLGTSTGYGELVPNNALATWPAAVSESAVPASGKGNIYPSSLVNQAIIAGYWTPSVRLTVIGTGASSITADILVRAWKWNSSSGYTKQGVIILTAQTISTSATTFKLPATFLSELPFNANESLYVDVLVNVTSNPNGAGVGTKIRCNFSLSASQGNITGQVVTPGTSPFRGVPATTALKATNTRTISSPHAALARLRTIPAKAALSGFKHRLVPAVASVCHGPLASPYVQQRPDMNYMTASGMSTMYKGSPIKLYGATIYLSTQGGTAAWQTDLTLVLDDLFFRAWLNGLNMIRITDYWSGSQSPTIGYDDRQTWLNIDYCVTKAQQYGMFVMMDVSGMKALLTAQGKDPTNAANWTDFLSFVGLHYKNTATSICWYNLSGEPSLPTDQASVDALVNFYATLCNTVHTADNGTHLISSGGLTHMNNVVSGISYPTWWYPIFANIATNTICSIKDYSVNDLAYLSTIQSIFTANNINKPISCNEFGAQQEQGSPTFPVFTNTLAAPITQGGAVTSLTFTAPINQQILAGTILSLTGTENCTVATTTSSGTSLAVNSFTATFAHRSGDAVTALGFADVDHSLGDTVNNFYGAVFGTVTSLLKWNNGPRTLVATSVAGGDQIGISSYVVWNEGDQISSTGYDVSNRAQPSAWQVIKNKALGDGYRPAPFTIRQVSAAASVIPSVVASSSLATTGRSGSIASADGLPTLTTTGRTGQLVTQEAI
ncbi:MAG: cellulase family glycosylhydrolase [Ktedonobacteraceae bacterium]|nr:cellulase family glycosylhydrolase [Ktedonobacteraceae bacterium]